MVPASKSPRALLRVLTFAATSGALLHCGGVDATTMAGDPAADDTSSDAGRRRDSGSSASNDGGASRDSGPRTGDSGAPKDSGAGFDASSGDPGPLLWGIDTTFIYSIAIATGTVHRVANFSAGCDLLNDIAIDSSGQLYGAEDWTGTDADGGPATYYTPVEITVNTAASTATCTPVDPSIQSEQASLGFRAGGDMLGVSFVDSAEVATVNPASAVTEKNLFQLDVAGSNGDDVACSTSGTCWASIGEGTAPNIVAFADNLTGAATTVWNSTTICWGIAYANAAVYCFATDGTITKLDLTSSPATATALTLHMDDSSALPTFWSGAASRPN